jgi:YD repeat-containing protein
VAQCGDLRVAHALPALRGRGGVQQPVLLYTSATAHPIARLAAHVWYTSGSRPDSIRATLRVGGVVRRSGFFNAAAMVPGVAMRLMIGWDTHLQATGIYPYALELTPYVQGAAGTPVTVSDTFVVVNRRASHFAAGWWLAGLEQVLVQGDGSLLWLGGDGSAKRYASAGTNVWVAPSLTVADTITRSGSVFTRHAPGQVAVRFNGQGNHVATVRPLGDSTRFTYSSTGTNPQLASVITRAGQTITFGYVSGRLRTVTAPGASAPRVVTVQVNGGGSVTSITDPDTTTVTFGYHPFYPQVLTRRTDARGTATTYTISTGLTYRQSTIAMQGTGADIVTRIVPLESLGLLDGPTALVDTALAYTVVDGPRTDVGDSTRYWLDGRFGAPKRVLDAAGHPTFLARGDATYPALVTQVTDATGHVTQATYDAGGHVATVVDVGGLVPGRNDTTRYVWNQTFDVVEREVPPEGDSVPMAYDATTGTLHWRQDARGHSSRVTFAYYSGSGANRNLLHTITSPTVGGVTPWGTGPACRPMPPAGRRTWAPGRR